MNIMKKILCLFVCFAMLFCGTSCVSVMKVKVDVIDRTKLVTSAEVLFIETLSISNIEDAKLKGGVYLEQREQISSKIRESVDSLISKGYVREFFREKLLNDFQKLTDSIYLIDAIPKIEKGVSLVQGSLYSAEPLSDSNVEAVFTAANLFVSAKTQINQYLRQLPKSFASFTNNTKNYAPILLVDEIIQPTKKSIEESNNYSEYLKILNNGLFNDPLNSIVVKAPEGDWDNVYNKTVARNFLGNTDIAVVMETPGNFFIKGVRMDAEDVTKTLAESINQGVKLLAKVNGIPVNPSGTVDPSELSKQNKIAAQSSNIQQAQLETEVQQKPEPAKTIV